MDAEDLGRQTWRLLKATMDDLPFYDASPGTAVLAVVGGRVTAGKTLTLVEAACEIAAAASFWVTDAAKVDEAKALLMSAINGMAGGAPLSASSKSLLDYVVCLPNLPASANGACRGPGPFTAAGTVNMYAGLGVCESTIGGGGSATLGAIKPVLENAISKFCAKTFQALGIKKPIQWDDYVPFFSSLGAAKQLVGELKEAKATIRGVSELAKLPHEIKVREILELLQSASGARGRDAADAIADVTWHCPRPIARPSRRPMRS